MDKSKLTILDLCGGTGAWSKPYAEAGYNVILVTLPSMNVLDYTPPSEVHGILAAPPCDHFAVSGAQYWFDKDYDGRTDEGLKVVNACLKIIKTVKPAWWALENPVGRLPEFIGKWKFKFDPCDFGDPYTKKTCLWGRFNIPQKSPVAPEIFTSKGKKGSRFWVALGGKSARTKELRSLTPPGFAKAFFEANP